MDAGTWRSKIKAWIPEILEKKAGSSGAQEMCRLRGRRDFNAGMQAGEAASAETAETAVPRR
jgi:hypothetical protein